MKRISHYLLLSSALLLASACSIQNDDSDMHDSPDYTVPYLA